MLAGYMGGMLRYCHTLFWRTGSNTFELAFQCTPRAFCPHYFWCGSIPFRTAYLLTVITIIQKRKTRTLQTQETSLQYTSKLLRYVIEHSRYAIAVHDTDLHYLFVSQKYCEEYHIPDGNAIIGKHHYEVIPGLPEKWKLVHQRCLHGEIVTGDDDAFVHEDGSVDYTLGVPALV